MEGIVCALLILIQGLRFFLMNLGLMLGIISLPVFLFNNKNVGRSRRCGSSVIFKGIFHFHKNKVLLDYFFQVHSLSI